MVCEFGLVYQFDFYYCNKNPQTGYVTKKGYLVHSFQALKSEQHGRNSWGE